MRKGKDTEPDAYIWIMDRIRIPNTGFGFDFYDFNKSKKYFRTTCQKFGLPPGVYDYQRANGLRYLYLFVYRYWENTVPGRLEVARDPPFLVNTDPDPWFWWSKTEKKNLQVNLFKFFLFHQKNEKLSLGLQKGRPNYRRILHPSNDFIQHVKT